MIEIEPPKMPPEILEEYECCDCCEDDTVCPFSPEELFWAGFPEEPASCGWYCQTCVDLYPDLVNSGISMAKLVKEADEVSDGAG